MPFPVIQSEGVAVGGVTQTSAAFTYRTDAVGQNASMELFTNAEYLGVPVGTVVDAALNANNNRKNTTEVSNLTEGTEYFWRVKCDDGAGDITYGVAPFTANSFKTLPKGNAPMRIGFLACVHGSHMLSDGKSLVASYVFNGILSLRTDFNFWLGDTSYSDAGIARAGLDYIVGTWRIPSDATATLADYRTNHISTYGALELKGRYNFLAELDADAPSSKMHDDHDSGKNDYSDKVNMVGDEKARLQFGMQHVHESLHVNNKHYIEQDAGRTFEKYTAPNVETDGNREMYHKVDLGLMCRVVNLDTREFRGANGAVDSPSNTMLGAKQLQVFEDYVKNNPCPEKELVVCSSVRFFGDPRTNAPSNDNWTSRSYERNAIFNIVRQYGNPAKTVFIHGDTHRAAVMKQKGSNGQDDIYIFCACPAFQAPTDFTSKVTKTVIEDSPMDYEIVYEGEETNSVLTLDIGDGNLAFTLFNTSEAYVTGSDYTDDEYRKINPTYAFGLTL